MVSEKTMDEVFKRTELRRWKVHTIKLPVVQETGFTKPAIERVSVYP